MAKLQSPIPITVITGFLGSGKTTLLSVLLKQKEMANTAVIINEFGKIGLDHALIESSDENIVELRNGCICCTIRDDLNKTLLGLIDKMSKDSIPKFDRVVIETTGLADPVPIIHLLMTTKDLLRVYKLGGVVTVVDAVNGNQTLNEYKESVKQIVIAERIILSKTDLAEDDETHMLLKRLQSLNPSAEIIQAQYGDADLSSLCNLDAYDPYKKSEDVKEWLKHETYHDDYRHHDHNHHHHNVNRHSEEIEAFSFVYDKPVRFPALVTVLQYLSETTNADLIRVKGIVNIEDTDRAAMIHGVQGVFYPVQWLNKWPDDDRRTKLVFITRNMKKEQVEQLFRKFMEVVENSIPKEPMKRNVQPINDMRN